MQATVLSEIAASPPRPLVAVDVGCGDGTATAVAATRCGQTSGANVTIIGPDWSCAALGRARRRGVPVVRAVMDGSGLPLASGSVDVIMMSELIEHLVDTDAALTRAGRVPVPDGSLLLSGPGLAAWYDRVPLAPGIQPLFTEVGLRGICGRPGREAIGHLRIFTRSAPEELPACAGPVEIDITGTPHHDVPRPFRPLDRLLCRTPGLWSIPPASARWPT
jgi:SAM-dependent methyltransferase